jgi:hypothetical protein
MKEAQEDQARKAATSQALFRDVNERIEEPTAPSTAFSNR